VREFAAMMRNRSGTRDLPRWIDRVDADALPAYTASPTASAPKLAAARDHASFAARGYGCFDDGCADTGLVSHRALTGIALKRGPKGRVCWPV
jgi:hypothetical protein